jgi:hypothetical protein
MRHLVWQEVLQMPLTETDIKARRAHPERHRWVSDRAGLYLRIAPSDRTAARTIPAVR